MAKYTGSHLLDVWLDERGPWRDLVGVFAKQALPRSTALARSVRAVAPVEISPGTVEEETTRGSVDYLVTLARLHEILRPS